MEAARAIVEHVPIAKTRRGRALTHLGERARLLPAPADAWVATRLPAITLDLATPTRRGQLDADLTSAGRWSGTSAHLSA